MKIINKFCKGILGLRLFIVFSLIIILFISGCKPVTKLQVDFAETTEEQNRVQITEQANSTSKANPITQVSPQALESPQVNSQADSQLKISPPPQEEYPRSRAVPILYYHSIAREAGNELRVPVEEFEAHMNYLKQAGFKSITLQELFQHYSEGLELPKKPFVLTFDDGYADNYANAFKIAKQYGFTGTIFMVTDWIDGTGYLTREQLRELSAQGWQIEAHTVSHPRLNEIDTKQLEKELSESKKKLEEILNLRINFLAYPFGIYSDQIIQKAREAGYLMGLTTNRGWAVGEEPFLLQRVYCYANMGLNELKRRVENPNY